MATIEEVSAEVQQVKSNLESIDNTLNVVAEKIAALLAGQVTQEQIDELASLVSSAKELSGSVKSEAEALVASGEEPSAPVE